MNQPPKFVIAKFSSGQAVFIKFGHKPGNWPAILKAGNFRSL